jgi:Holliday junction resolvasome RuvABC endonuclease subunit
MQFVKKTLESGDWSRLHEIMQVVQQNRTTLRPSMPAIEDMQGRSQVDQYISLQQIQAPLGSTEASNDIIVER